MISRFVAHHPNFVMVDRSQQKRNWGTLELAFPEARAYAVSYNRRFLENYPFDGIAINFRNEFGHADFGDQYGFGQPIVDEYQRRYKVNILREQFDLEQWRHLCGEYLTQFIRELSEAVHSKNKSLIVGIGQGNYIGLPNGNMYVDWQGWVKSQQVDGLVIGDITGQFLFPDRVGYGYLTEQESGIGVPNILWALQSGYWPLCATYGVKLYVKVYAPGFKDIPVPAFMKSNVDGVVLSMTQIVGDHIVTEEPGTILRHGTRR